MNTMLSLLPLLFTASFQATGASLSPDLNQHCPADITISGDEEWANISTAECVASKMEILLYMQLVPGFKGYRLVVWNDGWQIDNWFPLDKTCFTRDVEWWYFGVNINIGREDLYNRPYLRFEVYAGDCALHCHRIGSFTNKMYVTLVAHGPSRWRLKSPRPTCTLGGLSSNYTLMNCTPTVTTPTLTNPPTRTVTTLTTPTMTMTTNTTPTNTTTRTTPLLITASLPATAASLSTDLDQRCPADITISGDEEWANISTAACVASKMELLLYVHPDPGFKGYRLMAWKSDWQIDTWFPLDKTCFTGDADWWYFGVNLNIGWEDLYYRPYLQFEVNAGNCALNCHRLGYFTDKMYVTLVAHGRSRWRLKSPRPSCTVEGFNSNFSLINCTPTTTTPTMTNPPTRTVTTLTTPTNTTATTTPTTTIIITIAALVMIGVGVVVVWLVRKRIHHPREAVPRVPTRRGLAAFRGAGGAAADDDNYVDPPRVPTVLPRVGLVRGEWRVVEEVVDDDNYVDVVAVPRGQPPRQEPDYLYFGGEAGEEPIYEEIDAPRVSRVPPRVAPRQEGHGYLNMGDGIDLPAPLHVYENGDTDDGTYLTPRRAPPGTPSGATEG
ncbi:uncharacterized protein LOC127006069 [Eriocheir sinensis]|uniref:uncharacterized protein LOC127006069 n=1 Tax=Eriocheir sinensis TaxID=95602 RepID=UPI0021C820A0|nr:uncharacterized protein LOC127006069 [Eriocheir sinensis]